MDKRLREQVLERDGECVVQRWWSHRCKTTWGQEHAPTDLSMMTMEHVKIRQPMGGLEKPRGGGRVDSLQTLLTACGYANTTICLTHSIKEQERQYLADLYA